MKTFKTAPRLFVGFSLLLLAACSSLTGTKAESGKELAVSGPTVVDVKASPSTFTLNQALQPVSRSEVIANVKDFTNPITQVQLRFTHIPLQIPMKKVNSSTWVATIPPNQLKELAVNGHTMKYEANVIATNRKGMTAVSSKPVEIAVKAPEVNATG